jgi:hypothetical protein
VPARLAVAAVIFATWWAMNWRSLVITAGVMTAFTLFAAMCSAGKRRELKRDPLDELMDKYRKDENR